MACDAIGEEHIGTRQRVAGSQMGAWLIQARISQPPLVD